MYRLFQRALDVLLNLIMIRLFSVRPFFLVRPEASVGLAGGSLLLPCRVSGSPKPRVYWRRLDATLPVSRIHYTEVRCQIESVKVLFNLGSTSSLFIVSGRVRENTVNCGVHGASTQTAENLNCFGIYFM